MNDLKTELKNLIQRYQPKTTVIIDGRTQQRIVEITKNQETIKLPVLDHVTQINTTSF